ncbi:proximal tail fiber subunit [Klebsiella phage CPRSA]|nr:proximal tail fiber subunit [Klebsiella phage CPRSA]
MSLVATGGAPNTNTDRAQAGTGVYDHSDYQKAVTPKTLREYKATQLQSGAVWLASETEVINGTVASANIPNRSYSGNAAQENLY